MKGPGCDPEVAEAVSSRGELFRLAADHAYTIPGTTHDRRLVVFERRNREQANGADSPVRQARGRAYRRAGSAVACGKSRARPIPTFQHCREILGGPGIRKHGEAILSGARIRAEVLARFRDRVLGWLTGPEGPPPPDDSIEWLRFGGSLFKQIDVVGTHDALLLVKVPEIARWSDALAWPAGCTVFVPFQDPENVGAVIRSAAAFGAARVVLLREAAHPFLPRASRAAGPALFQVTLASGAGTGGPSSRERAARSPSTRPVDELERDAVSGAVRAGRRRGGARASRGIAAVERRRIPIAPGVESLNAATAAAIALYTWARQPCQVVS